MPRTRDPGADASPRPTCRAPSATELPHALLLSIVDTPTTSRSSCSAKQEAPVNRFRSCSAAVTSALAACGLALVTVLSGCSAGPITQTAVQEPSINGTAAIAGDPTTGIALRNVHLRVDQ